MQETGHNRTEIRCIATAYGDVDGVIGIPIDATLANSYSDKQCAASNLKGGYGFHPLTAWCDNTGECLAIIPRAGNAGSNTAADHIAIIGAAIAAVPAKYRRNLLITIDGAGSSHEVIEHLSDLNARTGFCVPHSVGFDLDKRVQGAIALLPGHEWEAALDATGAARQDAQVAEVTGLLRDSVGGDTLSTWPAGMGFLVRREPIEEGNQLLLFEQPAGYRYQPIATRAERPRQNPSAQPPHPVENGGQQMGPTKPWPKSKSPSLHGNQEFH